MWRFHFGFTTPRLVKLRPSESRNRRKSRSCHSQDAVGETIFPSPALQTTPAVLPLKKSPQLCRLLQISPVLATQMFMFRPPATWVPSRSVSPALFRAGDPQPVQAHSTAEVHGTSLDPCYWPCHCVHTWASPSSYVLAHCWLHPHHQPPITCVQCCPC